MDETDFNAPAGPVPTEPVVQVVEAVATVAAVLPQVIADPIGAAISGLEAWWEQHVTNSVFSQDTATHNALFAHKQGIRLTLENHLKG